MVFLHAVLFVTLNAVYAAINLMEADEANYEGRFSMCVNTVPTFIVLVPSVYRMCQ